MIAIGASRSFRSTLLDFPQILDGLQHGLAGRRSLELDCSEQRWQKAPNACIAANQFPIIDVLWWANERVHLADGGFQCFPFQCFEDCGSQISILEFGIEDQSAHLRELDGSRVQILDCSQPCLVALAGSVEHFREENVQQIQGIIQSCCFKIAGERH
jgi:hypothetical protein